MFLHRVVPELQDVEQRLEGEQHLPVDLLQRLHVRDLQHAIEFKQFKNCGETLSLWSIGCNGSGGHIDFMLLGPCPTRLMDQLKSDR